MSQHDPHKLIHKIFADGGEAGRLLQAMDWSSSPLGEPGTWPAELRSSVSIMLRTPHAMHLCWGPDLITLYNDSYVAILGGKHPSAFGKPFCEIWPDAWDKLKPLTEVALSGKAQRFVDLPVHLHGQGEQERWFSFSWTPLRDDAFAVQGFVCEAAETTDKMLALRAAQQERESFTAADTALRALNADLEEQVISKTRARGHTWQITPNLLAVMRPDEHFEEVNPAWTAALGWSEAEMKAVPYTSFVHPDDLNASADAYELVRQGDPVLRFENRYRCRDGSYKWLSWVAVPEGDRYYCTVRDITTEKNAEAERDQLWALSEDMLARADYGGGMSAVNPAWTKVLGYTQHQLLTNPYADIIHPDDVGATVAALTSMGETGRPTRFENRILALNGEWKPIGWTVSPEPDGVNFVAVGRDLADIKARERELLQAQEALRQAQKMEAVGQLTGGIAHDFNNLLAGISGSLEQLTKRIAQGRFDTVEKYVAMAQGSARRAATLTQRLLAFSRRQTLDPRPIDANRLVLGLEELVRRTVGPSVQVQVRRADGLWPINVDASQLENSLLNLCINARDAMLPQGGRLVIETCNHKFDEREARERDLAAGEYISVCVTDSGTGMTPEIAARAFDPFFTTKPLGQGTGLGLSMIYGFVRQSGGQVRIDSEPGKGTTMCLYFPAYVGDEPLLDVDTQGDFVAPGGGEVVLVIDDEAIIRMVIVEVLEESGYTVLEAEDGPSGLKILQSGQRIDLLVTDVGLPGGMNGRQVADAARVARPGLKVLFITGYAENAAVGNGYLEAGMEVLTKPFEMTALANKVGDILDS
ncbi:MAG: PAS domain S-box protein [Pseudomonadota bacterium]